MTDNPDSDLSGGQNQFLDQYTRHLMVQWCHSALVNSEGTGIPVWNNPEHGVYRNHAVTKKWISAKDGKVLSAGWKTGATFLKR